MARVGKVAPVLVVTAALLVGPVPVPLASAGDCPSGLVALTFDDGPAVYTPGILDVLAARGALATFFVSGYRVAGNAAMVQRAFAEGHVIANHAYSHKALTAMGPDQVRAELIRTRDLVEEAGVPMTPIVRPPYGAYNATVERVVAAEGMRLVWATLDSGDYRGISAATLARRVLANLRADANIIFHDGINQSRTTLAALGTIIDGLRARGYCTGVLDEAGAIVPFRQVPESDPPPPCADPGGCDEVGFVDPAGAWHVLDFATAEPEVAFHFGNPGDIPLTGDWDCDGVDSAGVYRPATGNVHLASGRRGSGTPVSFTFGDPGDVPLVGDWDGDGCDTLGVYRKGRAYLSDRLGPGIAEIEFTFGNPGDVPFPGDFDGDGDDELGLHRPTTGTVYLRSAITSGAADAAFVFGDPGDLVVAGDWDGDGIDTVASYRRSHRAWYLRLTNTAGPADHTLYFGDGRSGSWPIVTRFGP